MTSSSLTSQLLCSDARPGVMNSDGRVAGRWTAGILCMQAGTLLLARSRRVEPDAGHPFAQCLLLAARWHAGPIASTQMQWLSGPVTAVVHACSCLLQPSSRGREGRLRAGDNVPLPGCLSCPYGVYDLAFRQRKEGRLGVGGPSGRLQRLFTLRFGLSR